MQFYSGVCLLMLFAGCFTADGQDCKVTKKGREYRGFTNTTSSGLSCQNWDSNSPHSHANKKASRPKAGLDKNYCRNPDSEPNGPWCYTLSIYKRWEFCNIPICSEIQRCKRLIDVVLLFELPKGKVDIDFHVMNLFMKFKENVKPSLQCVRLELIIVWKHVDIISRLDCSYGEDRCYHDSLTRIRSLRKELPAWQTPSKNNLIEGIETAQKHLFSKEHGARNGAEKALILVLCNPPVKGVMSTIDAVKDMQDMGVRIISIGIGDGRKEQIDKISLKRRDVIRINEFKEIRSRHIDWKSILKLTEENDKMPSMDFELGRLQSPISDMVAARASILQGDARERCKFVADIGFLIDSSGSLRNDYQDEKFFAQRMAARFGISESGSRAGVIIFSSSDYVLTAIKFNQYKDFQSFKLAVDMLPFHGYMTRIDLALKTARKELFVKEAGSRKNVSRVAFLITDGRQNPDIENGTRLNPSAEAAKLRENGVKIIAVGIGGRINKTELTLLAGSSDDVYTVANFQELIKDEFVKSLSTKICHSADISPKKKDLSEEKDKKETKTQTDREKCKERTKCKNEADCSKCCPENPPTYINVFNENKSKNKLLQMPAAEQTGASNTIDSIGFDLINAGGDRSGQGTSSESIVDILKALLPKEIDKLPKITGEEVVMEINKRRK